MILCSILLIINIFLLLVISALYADRLIYMYARGDDFTMINDKVYDVLKWVAIIALPALSTFIVVVGKIWNWGDIAGMVAQTVTAVAGLLGALLGISHIQYKNGVSDDGD